MSTESYGFRQPVHADKRLPQSDPSVVRADTDIVVNMEAFRAQSADHTLHQNLVLESASRERDLRGSRLAADPPALADDHINDTFVEGQGQIRRSVFSRMFL